MRDCIPARLGPLLENLDNEVTWLHGRWIIYRQLYARSPERLDLLNASAGTFFYVLQWLFLDDITLSIARLTDPLGSGDRQNAVLGQLLIHPNISAEPNLRDAVDRELKAMHTLAEPFRLLRNKRIAHRDIRYALKVEGAELPGVSYEAIEMALAQVRRVMNTINVHFCESETAYEIFSMLTDGDALIDVLKRGLAFRQAELSSIVPWDYLDASKFGRV